jgi:hypothetical protein
MKMIKSLTLVRAVMMKMPGQRVLIKIKVGKNFSLNNHGSCLILEP